MHPFNVSAHCVDSASAPPSVHPRPACFPCPTCGKSFRRRFTLKQHLATHTGAKPFVCSVEACDHAFTTAGNLSRHQRVQHPWLDTVLECLVDHCGCLFPTERALERHMAMVHFSVSTHVCPVPHCGCAFTRAGNLQRHMKRRHSQLSFEDSKQKTKRVSPSAVDIIKLEDLQHGFTIDDTELLDALACLFD